MRRDARLCAFVVVVAVFAAACEQPRSIVTKSDIEESVVRITGTACLKPILATGFVVADGLVVTVAHATAGAEDDLRIVDAFGVSHDVEVVAFDDELDIVVLSVDGLGGTAIRPASAEPGDTGVITAMASDSGINFIDYEVRRIVNARSGDIYDLGRVERTAIDVLTTAKRGTSGAPLLNDAGDYIGMVFAISRDRENGVYALASSEIADYLASLPTGITAEIGRCR